MRWQLNSYTSKNDKHDGVAHILSKCDGRRVAGGVEWCVDICIRHHQFFCHGVKLRVRSIVCRSTVLVDTASGSGPILAPEFPAFILCK